MLDAVRRLFAADRAAICEQDESGGYVSLASFGLSTAYVQMVCCHATAAPVLGRVIATRQPAFVEDVSAATRGTALSEAVNAEGVLSVLGLPLLGRARRLRRWQQPDTRSALSSCQVALATARCHRSTARFSRRRLHNLAYRLHGFLDGLRVRSRRIVGHDEYLMVEVHLDLLHALHPRCAGSDAWLAAQSSHRWHAKSDHFGLS